MLDEPDHLHHRLEGSHRMGTAPTVASAPDRARTRWHPATWSDRTIAIALALLAIVVRLPFRAQFLTNWDSVNFALGIGGFDLATHQPHPPGYIGWVALSRAMTWVTSDPNAAMTLLSAVAGAAATALAFKLARRFVGRTAAIVAALLFSTAPLIWYYSVVSLSYMTTGAVALALLLLLLTALQNRSLTHLVLAGVVMALVGALRPTDEALLFPAWAIVMWTFPWRERITATLVMGVASLAWVAPLIWLSGGLGAFTSQGEQVADLAGGRTWILGGNLAGIGQNFGMVAAGLALGLFGGLVVLVVARIAGIRPFGALPRDQRRLLLAWVSPALAVYLLLHTGQLGYVVLLLPVAYVGVARALPQLPGALRARAVARRRSRASWSLRRPGAAVASLLAVNTLAFLVLPAAGLRMIAYSAESSAAADPTAPPHSASMDRTRQYSVAANDAHWRMLTGLIQRYDHDTTAVVTETSSGGSFRHLSYYAPDNHVFGFGWDRTGDLGYLFHAQDRRTTYSVEKLRHADDELLLPAEVRTLIVPDARLLERLAPPAMGSIDRMLLEDGTQVAVIHSSEPMSITVDNPLRVGGEVVDGFPSAADSNETEDEEAVIRVLPSGAVAEATPSGPERGVTER